MYNRQLDTFIQVADAGSFSRAAEALYITPTAVIKQMNILEANLGLALFNRTHRGLTLTPSGESLYIDAKHVIQYSKEAVARAREAGRSEKQIIRVGTSLMTPSSFATDLWPRIQDKCPDLGIQLVPFENTPGSARRILGNLGEDIDIVAGVFDDPFLRSRGCGALELSRMPLCCAVSINDPLARLERLDIRDLRGRTLLLIQRGWNVHVDRLRDWLWERHPEVAVEDFTFYNVDVFNRCERGDEMLVSIKAWADVHPLLKVLPVDWDFSVPFGIFHSPVPSSHVRRLLDAVSDELALRS